MPQQFWLLQTLYLLGSVGGRDHRIKPRSGMGAGPDHTEVYVVLVLVVLVLAFLARAFVDTQQKLSVRKKLVGEKLL